MNLKDSNNIPEEFKVLAKDFSEKGFITTSLDNLINKRQFLLLYKQNYNLLTI